MYEYIIGLVCGGLMEDPHWHIEDVKTVAADNLSQAKDIWAVLTGEDKSPTWNAETKTVWGWELKLLNSNDPSVTENDFFKERQI